jgi:hypothetical protein
LGEGGGVKRNWPNWRPESELRATDLAGLEDYVLRRSDFVEEGLHGVDSFNYRVSLRLERDAGSALLKLDQVAGVTPSGQPVLVGLEDECFQLIDNPGQEPTLDVFVRVSDVSKDARASKLWLVAEPTSRGADAAVSPGKFPDRLFLGRYSFDLDGKPSVVHFPMVRRFAALQPHDETWQEWTRPIRTSLEAIATTPVSAKDMPMVELVRSMEATKLRYTWATIPVTVLRQQLQLLRRMGEVDENQVPVQVVEPWLTLQTELGSDLPRRLARILARLPQRPFATVLAEVIRPVTIRVPLKAFEEWSRHLANLERMGDSATEDGTGFDAGVEHVLESALGRHAMEDWTRIAGLTTIWSARTYHEPRWGEQMVTLYLTNPSDSIELAWRLPRGQGPTQGSQSAGESLRYREGPGVSPRCRGTKIAALPWPRRRTGANEAGGQAKALRDGRPGPDHPTVGRRPASASRVLPYRSRGMGRLGTFFVVPRHD